MALDAPGADGKQLGRLREELSGVARQIAALLTQPRYDEAALAELDVRAAALRSQIRAMEPPVGKG